MKIHDVKQGSAEWLTLRLGKVTASEADALVSPEGKVRTGEGVSTYVYKKVAEKLLGFSTDSDANTWQMDHGTVMEREALPWLEFTHNLTINRVGFVTTESNVAGASPDGLIGADGGVECKAPQPATALKYLIEGVLPKEYRVQVQFSMWVCNRPWWYFLSYSRQWPPLLLRVERDNEMQDAITEAVGKFTQRFNAAYDTIRAMRDAENTAKTEAYYANPENRTK